MRKTQFPPLQNDLILRVIRGEITNKIPVWVMRQAGRYMQEFRDMRSKYDFFTLCENPELASQVTLLPIDKFDLDAAIIFSDILVIPKALGMSIEMKSGVGPVFPSPLSVPKDIDCLDFTNYMPKLSHVFEAINLTRVKLNGRVPLIGFAGAPWTLMSYMIEGGGSKTLSKAKAWLYRYPEGSKHLLTQLTNIIIEYLVCQVEAGAQLLQVFESHAEYLGSELFKTFSLPYLKTISSEIKRKLVSKGLEVVPLIIFAKGCHYGLNDLKDAAYDVIGLDWTIDPSEARKLFGKIVLQGNLDPCALYSPKERLPGLVHKMITKFGANGLICNLGHGIYPDVDPDNLNEFVEAVHSYQS